MTKLHFETVEQFDQAFKIKSKKITDAIYQAIEEAVANREKTAMLFEISFDSADVDYEISLPKNQWPKALESCLKHYEELGSVNESIDAWKLLEAVKTF